MHKAIRDMFPNGVDCVIDTPGAPVIIEDGLRALRQRGKLVLIGVPPMQYELSLNAIEHINVCLAISTTNGLGLMVQTGRTVIGCLEGDCVPEEVRLVLVGYRVSN